MRKNIIITGAAQGIGQAVAKKLVSENYTVFACDIDSENLNILSEELPQLSFLPFRLDISNYNEVEVFFKKIKADKISINYLLNNAGIYLGKKITEYSREEIDKVTDINIKGAVYFSKFFGQLLLEQKSSGAIINMASVAGQEGSSDAIYGLTKSALIGLTKSCAMNFAPYIRVNAIAPTLVETKLIEKVPKWRVDEYRNHELIKEPVLPEDIAETVSFLLSNASRHYTGAVFDINNGHYLR